MSKYNYKGNNHPFAVVLSHSSDETKIAEILDKLSSSGLRLYLINENNINEKIIDKACSVIAFLSEKYYESESLQNAYLKAGKLGKNIISVRTDDAQMPEVLSNYSYSKNSLNMKKYDADGLIQRILSADEIKNPGLTKAQLSAYKRTVIGLVLAAVAVIAAIVVGVVSSSNSKSDAQSAEENDFLVQTGILEEDLENVKSFVMIGDYVYYSKFAAEPYDYVNDYWNDEHQKDEYVLIETGEKVEMGGPEDLSFLTRLPNLTNLILINQNADSLPDLSGLETLSCVIIEWSDIENLEGLRSCKELNYVSIQSDYISDLSPLNDCPSLNHIQIRDSREIKNFDSLSSSSINMIEMFSSTLQDISGLSGCENLSCLSIFMRNGGPQCDLTPLGKCAKLRELYVDTMSSQMPIDLSFVSSLSNLTSLDIWAESIAGGTDSIGNCQNLETLKIEIGDGPQYLDFSCLGKLLKLNNITLDNINCSLDFLKERAQNRPTLTRLSISGNNIDFSGLGSLTSLGTLGIGGMGNYDTSIFNNLGELTLSVLHINSFESVDLSELPEGITELSIENCNFDNLGELSCKKLSKLYFGKNTAITSLSGIEQLTNLKELSIWDCYRLTDIDALYDVKDIRYLGLTRQLVLPDYSKIQFQRNYLGIQIADIPGLTELSCLDVLTEEQVQNGNAIIDIQGNEVENLNALYRFKGDRLVVSDNLAVQAEDLIENECFKNLDIVYSDAWDGNSMNVMVNSLEELNSMPKALLKYIKYLSIAGDVVYDDNWWIGVDDMSDEKEVIASSFQDDSRNMVVQATQTLDMELISQLTGLEYLCLAKQKIDSLDGIQNLENLDTLRIINCDVEDISPIFAIDSIRNLTLCGDNITSINGIQNLINLCSLSIEYANVNDISPLSEIKFCSAVYDEGVELVLPFPWKNETYPTDVSAIAAPPKYRSLDLNNYNEQWGIEDWVPYLDGKEIVSAYFMNSFNSNEQLERFVDTVGSVRELNICYNDHLTDLSCLTRLNGLGRVSISSDMQAAINSLEGVDFSFELEIQG